MAFPPQHEAQAGASPAYEHWQQLNRWLGDHQAFWQPAPFAVREPGWVAENPALVRWLSALDEQETTHFEAHPEAFATAVQHVLPQAAGYQALTRVPDLQAAPETIAAMTLAERDATDMPGRKRLQAGALCAALAPLAGPALDWCCGKGHLARTLARAGAQPVTGFEWNRALVDDGNRLARRFGDPVLLQHQDVMAADLNWPARVHVIALHACGDLHRKLIRDGTGQQQPRISFSPCCYHLMDSHHLTDRKRPQPLSRRARDNPGALPITPEMLRLAVRETVTAPSRVRAQTRRARQWRLGFDGLQRALRNDDEYLPLPPHPAHLNASGFEAFCRWAAAEKHLALPAKVDWGYWEHYGAVRLKHVRQYELVRHLFRRPLELWLVLDYALALEEAGYLVRVGTFCERSLTPRNLLVDAVRN